MKRDAATKPRVHVATVLEGVQLSIAPELPPVESLRGVLAFDGGKLQRSTLSATWLGGPLTLKVAERTDRRGSALAVQAQGFIDATKLVALSQIKNLPEVTGETPWSGDFVYFPPTDAKPARWQGHADASLVGIASELPAPFAKLADSSVPLRVDITGSGEESEVRVNLADRAKTAFALNLQEGRDWRIARGVIQMGGGAASAAFRRRDRRAGPGEATRSARVPGRVAATPPELRQHARSGRPVRGRDRTRQSAHDECKRARSTR